MQCTQKYPFIIAFFKSNLINYRVKSGTSLLQAATPPQNQLSEPFYPLFLLLLQNISTIYSEDRKTQALRTKYTFCSDHQASFYPVIYHLQNLRILK